jgi:peptidoglycan/LPS O-acetylase OafA/YrhL
MSGRGAQHFAFIDSVRGYAVALVIICHATYMMPELPYPVHRVAVLGWHGVQLFFLASTVTLMMSRDQEVQRRGKADTLDFFIRRVFRIAPAYYVAALAYAFIQPPAGGMSVGQAAATLLFVNAWYPVWMGVTPSAWNVVPGSWSVGVEFTFYVIFPFIAPLLSSLTRSVIALALSILIGAVVNSALWPALRQQFGDTPADNFLYFWFPNQLSVFAIGFCLYHLMRLTQASSIPLIRWPNLMAGACVVLFAATGFTQLPHWLTWQTPMPPAFLYASLVLAAFVLALSRAKPGLFVNPIAGFMGKVSFSAYLSHYAAMDLIEGQTWLKPQLAVTGWPALIRFPVLLIAIFAFVALASWMTHSLIEQPMIGVGKSLLRRLRGSRHAGAALEQAVPRRK